MLSVKIASCEKGDIHLSYDPDLVRLALTPIAMDYGGTEILIGSAILRKGSRDTLIIRYTEGASLDPGFLFFWPNGKAVARTDYIDGLNLAIPGDGFFYTWGHTNSYFNIHRKFCLDNGVIHEIEQPFYYVGLKTVALKDLMLYSDLGGSTVSARVAAGDSIVVLINTGEAFLIKFGFDVLGWYRPKEQIMQWPTDIGGIFFYGD
jgi:hypothetical protein